MLSLEIRARIRALLKEGHGKSAVARELGVSLSTIKRIAKEPETPCLDEASERRRRHMGRPSVTAKYRAWIVEVVKLKPQLKTTEMLSLARKMGFDGGKTTFYDMVASVRRDLERDEPAPGGSQGPRPTRPPSGGPPGAAPQGEIRGLVRTERVALGRLR